MVRGKTLAVKWSHVDSDYYTSILLGIFNGQDIFENFEMRENITLDKLYCGITRKELQDILHDLFD